MANIELLQSVRDYNAVNKLRSQDCRFYLGVRRFTPTAAVCGVAMSEKNCQNLIYYGWHKVFLNGIVLCSSE